MKSADTAGLMNQDHDDTPNATCKLCRVGTNFVESHIYPRAFFKKLGTDSDPVRLIPARREEHTKRIRTGVYDQQLLCGGCETRTSAWDDAGISFARASPTNYWPTKESPKALAWTNQPYAELRLFALSLLWRAHSSELPVLRNVDLGPHAEPIRKLLLAGEPGRPENYPVCFFKTLGAPSIRPVILPLKKRLRDSGLLVWRMHLGTLELTVKVDQREYPESLRRFQLSPRSPVYAITEEFGSSTEAQMMRNFFRSRQESGF